MNVLQIACGFSYSSVYKNFFSELEKKGHDFAVYVPQHNDVNDLKQVEFPYSIYSSKVIKSYDKLIYFTKINRMVKDVELNFKLTDVKLIHSHSLFSDGAVAYELYKKYGIPYIVAVRNTDVNKYYKYAFHLRKYALNIMLNAQKVIFLSSAYRQSVIEKFIPSKCKDSIQKRSEIIPNGINSFWLENLNPYIKEVNKEKLKLICVGAINQNKNALKAAEACQVLISEKGLNIEFVLVGEVKDKKYFNLLMKYDFVTHIPHSTKEKLLSLYRESDIYIMPSINETFGLVYAEAMSQGLPVIYSIGQGFYNQFDEGIVGYGVDSSDKEEIASKVMVLVNSYSSIRSNCINLVNKFSWSKIASEYVDLYKEIIKNK